MEPLTLSSSPPPHKDDQHRDPDDSVDQSAAEVSFGFNQLQIDGNGANTQQLMPESAETDDEEGEDDDDEEEEEKEEEGDFTFMCIGDKDSLNTEEFEDGQIRATFPLFDQSLLLGGDQDGEGRRRLPISVPVDNVFISSPRRSPSSMASGHEDSDGVAEGTFCALSKESDTGTPEMNMKSNSTGFSKLWRFRDKMNRSNSDGRDAFVFLESPNRTGTTTSISSSSSSSSLSTSSVVDESKKKVNVAGGGKTKAVKKGSKAKKAAASAHEVYLKQRGGEEDRRRSYLPYRPGLMGFFTNVNGGLSKNVHPF